jgi:hypothetical protein
MFFTAIKSRDSVPGKGSGYSISNAVYRKRPWRSIWSAMASPRWNRLMRSRNTSREAIGKLFNFVNHITRLEIEKRRLALGRSRHDDHGAANRRHYIVRFSTILQQSPLLPQSGGVTQGPNRSLAKRPQITVSPVW